MHSSQIIREAEDIYVDSPVVRHYEEFRDLFPKEEKLLQLLTERDKSASIYFFGCGMGRVPAHFAKAGWEVAGVDLSAEFVARARARVPEGEFVVGDALEVELSPESYDYVCFPFNGIDHIHPLSERKRLLRKAYAALRSGGSFVYSSHNPLCVLTLRASRWRNALKNVVAGRVWSRYWILDDATIGRHLYQYGTPRRQKQELRRAGFEDIELVSDFDGELAITLRDQWPYYIACKPE